VARGYVPTLRVPVHPGDVLREDFLRPLGLTQVEVAEHLDVPIQRINELVRGKRGVTPETAWLLAEAFETSPQFWLSLQANYNLARVAQTRTRGRVPAIR